MKKNLMLFVSLLFCSACGYFGVGESAPPSTPPKPDSSTTQIRPLARKDGFFGVHFDFHAKDSDTLLGADASTENIATFLERVRPDWVQVDCKGHPGYTSYPTKVGSPSPGIVKDSLRLWRDETRRRGVALGVHYSGVWDTAAVTKRPDWAQVMNDGKPSDKITSTFGPYVDQLMIPQLRELIEEYAIDSIWADGECWAAAPDYSPAALAAWKAETGQDTAPKDANDPRWIDWLNFHRHQFEKYLCHWVDEVHKIDPTVNITSNWMYTTFAPQPIVANLDYISGDFDPSYSIDRARTEARYLTNLGKPWDLLSWGMTMPQDLSWSFKDAIQLQQEAGVVLMHGGGYNIYYNPTRSGYISDQLINTMAEVGDFCRQRQTVSHQSTSIPQVAVLYSSSSKFDGPDALFSNVGQTVENVEGALHAMLESHYSTDVLSEYMLQPRLAEFPLVVIPNAHRLTPEFCQAVLAYVQGGGQLLLLGDKSAEFFKETLDVELGDETPDINNHLLVDGQFVNAHGKWREVKPGPRARVIATRYQGNSLNMQDSREKGISSQYQSILNKQPAATVTQFGNGRIAAVYGPLPQIFKKGHHPLIRRFVSNITRELFPNPAVRLVGPPTIDLSLRRTRDGRLSLQLLNLSTMPIFQRTPFIDTIPSVGPLQVTLALDHKPNSVDWIPANGQQKLKWHWRNGQLQVMIPKLEVHGVLVVND